MGIFKTRERILSQYYWPSMIKDIKSHISSCHTCQTTRPYNHPRKAFLRPLEQAPNLNHRVHLDLFGPIISQEGKEYVLVMTDSFTKYVELAVIPDKNAETVADSFFSRWVLRYSSPASIVTDQGKEFCNSFMKKLLSHLCILHKTTTPYHPQTNSSAEIFNKTMKRYLQAVIRPPYLDWKEYIPALQFCFNTSVSKATKFSPHHLTFGMDSNMPFFSLDHFHDYSDDANLSRLKKLHISRQAAKQNNLEYKSTYEATFNNQYKTVDRTIKPGQYILVSQFPQQKFKNAKLQPLYEGPFIVTKVEDTTVSYLKNGKTCHSHINRVKAYVESTFLPKVSPKHRTSSKAPALKSNARLFLSPGVSLTQNASQQQVVTSPPLSPQIRSPTSPAFQNYRTPQASSESESEDDADDHIPSPSSPPLVNVPEARALMQPSNISLSSDSSKTKASPVKRFFSSLTRALPKRKATSPLEDNVSQKSRLDASIPSPTSLADQLTRPLPPIRSTRQTNPNLQQDLTLPGRAPEYKTYQRASHKEKDDSDHEPI